MKDSLGDRIKSNYENRYRFYLPRRTNVIIRLDGCHFHTNTKKCEKPFDMRLNKVFEHTLIDLVQNIQNCKIGYHQSDEISLLLTDYNDISTEAWYDNNLQKIASVSASMCTMYFNQYTKIHYPGFMESYFDSRVFVIPEEAEVSNYFLWRSQDCFRNAISSQAQALYSQKQLQNKNSNEMQEMCFEKGVNCSEIDKYIKNGRWINKNIGNFAFENKPSFIDINNLIWSKVDKQNEVK